MKQIPLKILYEDNHIICCVKPRGILSQADETGALDMLTLIKDYIAGKYQKKGNVYLGLIHRLDRPVGGVMVFARTSKAAARISAQIRERSVKKTYLAVVYGSLDVPIAKTDAVRLENRIRKDRNKNLVTVSEYTGGETGKHPEAAAADKEYAALEYQVLENSRSTPRMTLARVRLITGRPHQIRAQFAHIGNPVVGDRKYGLRTSKTEFAGSAPDFDTWRARSQPDWPALWAASLRFVHPVNGEILDISAAPPSEYPWSLFGILN